MAIKIPVRSSASESVGGSTIRIPRERGKSTVNLPKTNLLSSVPNAIAPAFDKLTQFLDVVSERKKANDRRIEEKRIRDKNTKNKDVFYSKITSSNKLLNIYKYCNVTVVYISNIFNTK